MPSDKHMEAARAVYDAVIEAEPFTRKSVEVISEALANAEREGMKRAADIARDASIFGNLNDVYACADLMDAWDLGSEDTIKSIANAILSEAGEKA